MHILRKSANLLILDWSEWTYFHTQKMTKTYHFEYFQEKIIDSKLIAMLRHVYAWSLKPLGSTFKDS